MLPINYDEFYCQQEGALEAHWGSWAYARPIDSESATENRQRIIECATTETIRVSGAEFVAVPNKDTFVAFAV